MGARTHIPERQLPDVCRHRAQPVRALSGGAEAKEPRADAVQGQHLEGVGPAGRWAVVTHGPQTRLLTRAGAAESPLDLPPRGPASRGAGSTPSFAGSGGFTDFSSDLGSPAPKQFLTQEQHGGRAPREVTPARVETPELRLCAVFGDHSFEDHLLWHFKPLTQ